jgi:short-subunit dehydrogenase
MKNRLLKSAMITGASSGIGEAYAHLLASLGYNLILVARRKDKLLSIASELENKYGIEVTVLESDLSCEAGISAAEGKIRAVADLSLLINNAGYGTLGLFVDVDINKTLNMIMLHVTAPTRLIKAALPGMLKRGEGIIINVASTAPFLPIPGNVNYNGTKSFLIAFSECLQLEVKDAGLIVQALCPGFTRTGFHSVDEYKNADFSTVPEFMWMPAEEVVKQSWKALRKKKVVFIPGFINRMACIYFGWIFRYITNKKPASPPIRK